MSDDIILQVCGLGISFGGVDVVKVVDFDLCQCELCCLIGLNGVGKIMFFWLFLG